MPEGTELVERRETAKDISDIKTNIATILADISNVKYTLSNFCGKDGFISKLEDRLRIVEQKQSSLQPVWSAINSIGIIVVGLLAYFIKK